MLDLRVMRDRWDEAGAREVFGYLVTHCARTLHHDATELRAAPGDEGIDAVSGLSESRQRVWQAKFFCNGIGKSQQDQVRSSWKSCKKSPSLPNLVQWTLCIPIHTSPSERRWWNGWKSRESKKHDVDIRMWDLTQFQSFFANPGLRPLFDIALGRDGECRSHDDALSAMEHVMLRVPSLQRLPADDEHEDAVFVRKLELAGVLEHYARRTAFYNFQLVREAIARGGSESARSSLTDLELRVLGVWEEEFTARPDDQPPATFVTALDRLLASGCEGRLDSPLRVSAEHRKGALYGWADVCRAGWTDDFRIIIEGD